MRSSTRYIALCIIHCALCIILTACKQIDLGPTLYHQYQSVNIEGWKIADSARFDIGKMNQSTTVHIALGIRSTNGYKYKDAKIAIEVMEVGEKNEKKVWRQQLQVNLYAEGDRATGIGFPYNENEIDLPTPLTLKADRQYIIRVTHAMGATPLEGISDIGIKLVK